MSTELEKFAYVGGSEWFTPSDLERALISDGWSTSDTYGKDYVPTPKGPGVYLFMLHTKPDFDRAVIAYVGMSRNLSKRAYGQHHARCTIENESLWPMVWFKTCDSRCLRDVERRYIKMLTPPLNVAGIGTRLKLVSNEAAN